MSGELRLRITSRNNAAYLSGATPEKQVGSRFSPRIRFSLLDKKIQVHLRGEGAFSNANRTFIGAKYWDSQPSSSLSRLSFLSFYEDQKAPVFGNLGLRRATVSFKPISDFRFQLGINRWDIKDLERVCMESVYSWACKFSFASLPIGLFGGEISYDRKRIKTLDVANSTQGLERLDDERCEATRLKTDKEKKQRCSRIYTSMRITPGGKLGAHSQLFLLGQAGGEIKTPMGLGIASTGYLGAYENKVEAPPLFEPGWTMLTGLGVWTTFKGFRLLGAYGYRKIDQKDNMALPIGEERSTLTVAPSYEIKLKKGGLRLQGTASFLKRYNKSSELKNNKTINKKGELLKEKIVEGNVSYQTPNFLDKFLVTLSLGYYGSWVPNGARGPIHGILFGLRTDFRNSISLKKRR